MPNPQYYANLFFLGTDDDHRVVLESIFDGVDCEHDYMNASYIDVRPLENAMQNLTGEEQHELDLSMLIT